MESSNSEAKAKSNSYTSLGSAKSYGSIALAEQKEIGSSKSIKSKKRKAESHLNLTTHYNVTF